MTYPIIEVAPEQLIGDEQLGSKPKVWYLGTDGREWLFKEARTNTGEDWAEKIAAEIARLIGVNAAVVELATCGARRGAASRSFIRRGTDNLVHGNEILAGLITGYDRDKKQRQSDHTLENIVGAVSKILSGDEGQAALRTLASYLVLDALIGNTDRHHENWGLLLTFERVATPPVVQLSVAPSFDHASALSRELHDEKRSEYLSKRNVEKYVRAGRGGIYDMSTDPYGANPLGLALKAAKAYPAFFLPSLQALSNVRLADISVAIDEVPAYLMSDTAKLFTREMVTFSYNALVGVLE